jgi:hypothetical protein
VERRRQISLFLCKKDGGRYLPISQYGALVEAVGLPPMHAAGEIGSVLTAVREGNKP